MRSRTPFGIAAAAAAAMLLAPAARADSHPDSISEPEQAGCGRDPLGLLAGTSPQWAYVHRDPAPVYASGTAVNARPTETDLLTAHDSYDMNVFFRPDPQYGGLLGTANIRPGQDSSDEQDTMEIEWEQRAYPLFAWPTAGDRVEVMGSWIFDCGHWGPQDLTNPDYFTPGTQPGEIVTGERTEIHPPRMVVVHRAAPSVSQKGEAVADVLISSDGTLARGVQDRAAGVCTAAKSRDCPQWTPVNDRDYEFDVAAPPRPAGATTMQWRVVDQGSVNAPEPVVTATATGAHVRVPFKGWRTDGQRMVLAKTVVVGWDVPAAVRHLRVTLVRLDWLTELDGTQPSGSCTPGIACTGNFQNSNPPDEVNVYAEVAGQWKQVDVPGLMHVAPGDSLPLQDAFDVYLNGSPQWRVYGRGRECDMENMLECPAPSEFGLNDDAGIFWDRYTGADGASGEHVGVATSNECAHSASQPCFRLTYRIDDLGTTAVAAVQATPTPQLPATGAEAGRMALMGLALVLAGWAALTASSPARASARSSPAGAPRSRGRRCRGVA